MSKQVRFRRGTTAEHASFTGAEAEVTVDTTKAQVVVHDGATAGGIPLLREDRPRGFTTMEIVTSSPYTWTQTGKTDLKRVRVTCYGGGAGGNGQGGGGAGGVGFVVLEAANLSTNVTVTIGAGGSAGNSGGTTSFGTYIIATGGSPGGNMTGGAGGSASGTGVYILGGQGGQASPNYGWGGFPSPGHPGINNTGVTSYGGGIGGGAGNGRNADGILGAGGGGGGAGAQGCCIIEEIYGQV